MARAMQEGYGVGDVKPNGSYHGAYADALERIRSQARPKRSRTFHPGQLARSDQRAHSWTRPSLSSPREARHCRRRR